MTIEQVRQAAKIIDDFVNQEDEQETIELAELIDLVADEVGMCPNCVGKVLCSAFVFLMENDLGVELPDDEDDEEEEDDERFSD